MSSSQNTARQERLADLLQAHGVALHEAGATTGDTERRLQRLLRRYASSGSAIASPTALWLQVGPLARIVRLPPAGLDVGRLCALRAWAEHVHAEPLSLDDICRLHDDAVRPQPPPSWHMPAGMALMSVAGAFLLGSGWPDVVAAVVVAESVRRLAGHLGDEPVGHVRLLVLAAWANAAASLLAVVAAAFAWSVHPVAVAMVSLLAFVPGYSMTTAMIEAASGHTTSSTARMASVVSDCVQLAAGFWVTTSLTTWATAQGAALPSTKWAPGVAFIGVALAPFGFQLLLQGPRRLLPGMVAAAVGGFALAQWVSGAWGLWVAALWVGALGEWMQHRRQVPALAIVAPGLLLLVPGVLSVRGMQGLLGGADVQAGIEVLRQALVQGGALAAGVLLAVAFSPWRGAAEMAPPASKPTQQKRSHPLAISNPAPTVAPRPFHTGPFSLQNSSHQLANSPMDPLAYPSSDGAK